MKGRRPEVRSFGRLIFRGDYSKAGWDFEFKRARHNEERQAFRDQTTWDEYVDDRNWFLFNAWGDNA